MKPVLRSAVPILMAAVALGHTGCGSKTSERTPTGPQPPASGDEGRVTAMTHVPLGFVQQFGVLAASGVTAAGTAVVNGDIGSCPNPSITGAGLSAVPPFTIHPAADAVVCQAQIDATALSTALLGLGPGTPLGMALGGTMVGPGVYTFMSTADIAAGTTFTLSGAGSYTFLVGSALTANVLSSVALIGVDSCDVFWRVGTDATLNGATFSGTVVAHAGSVSLGTGANLAGRAVSRTAAVTMAGTGQTIGGCSALVAGGGGGGGGVPTLPYGMEWALLVILLGTGAYIVSRR